jgi:hypothetical protein
LAWIKERPRRRRQNRASHAAWRVRRRSLSDHACPLLAAAMERATAMRLARFVKFREEKFGGVLFETRSEQVFTLNPSGAAVVREIAAGREAPEIAARLTDRFAAPEGAIEREVGTFLASLREKGLVED